MNSSILAASLLIFLLCYATYTDITQKRIPNLVSIGGALAAIFYWFIFEGAAGLAASFSGLAVGFALFLPFYLFKGMGAGDVKLMGMVGAFTGPQVVLGAVAGTLIVGAMLAIFYMLFKNMLNGSKRTPMAIFFENPPPYADKKPTPAGVARFPYAAAIAVGSLLGIWIGNQSLLIVTLQ